MSRVTWCLARGQRSHEWSGLALLLLFLTGCAAKPAMRGPGWYGQHSPLMAQDLPATVRAGQQAVEVDFEQSTAQQAERLRQSGVQLPRVSERTADPREHQDFVDLRVKAVGFGITAGGYLLYCEGLSLPVLVPESHVDLGLMSAEPLNASIHPDRDAALADLAASSAPGPRHSRYAYYRGAAGALTPGRRGQSEGAQGTVDGQAYWPQRNSECAGPGRHSIPKPVEVSPFRGLPEALASRDVFGATAAGGGWYQDRRFRAPR